VSHKLTCQPFAALLTAVLLSSCADTPAQGGSGGTRHTHRFKLPVAEAAQCFARNVRNHSSALVADVHMKGKEEAEVDARVKNGVPYASARLERTSGGTRGTITLYSRSTGSRQDLLSSLTEGC
jgi:hypothetical protein